MACPPLFVHLDLKGAPPHMGWLLSLLPRLRAWGAAGLLVEWEDSFPWDGDLRCLRAATAYTRAEVVSLASMCEALDLELIPLVQTFGHLEFVLKHDRFAHLRESPDEVNCLCPALAESRALVEELVRQVVALTPAVQHVHVGCDEVYEFGHHPATAAAMAVRGGSFFLDHVRHAALAVRAAAPGATALVWHDEIARLGEPAVARALGGLASAVVWCYSRDGLGSVDQGLWESLARALGRGGVWGASAFKGAARPDAVWPPVAAYVCNQAAWRARAQHEAQAGRPLGGVVLTGWSRFNHLFPLCEALPWSLPSLSLCMAAWTPGIGEGIRVYEGQWLQRATAPASTHLQRHHHPRARDVEEAALQQVESSQGEGGAVSGVPLLQHWCRMALAGRGPEGDLSAAAERPFAQGMLDGSPDAVAAGAVGSAPESDVGPFHAEVVLPPGALHHAWARLGALGAMPVEPTSAQIQAAAPGLKLTGHGGGGSGDEGAAEEADRAPGGQQHLQGNRDGGGEGEADGDGPALVLEQVAYERSMWWDSFEIVAQLQAARTLVTSLEGQRAYLAPPATSRHAQPAMVRACAHVSESIPRELQRLRGMLEVALHASLREEDTREIIEAKVDTLHARALALRWPEDAPRLPEADPAEAARRAADSVTHLAGILQQVEASDGTHTGGSGGGDNSTAGGDPWRGGEGAGGGERGPARAGGEVDDVESGEDDHESEEGGARPMEQS